MSIISEIIAKKVCWNERKVVPDNFTFSLKNFFQKSFQTKIRNKKSFPWHEMQQPRGVYVIT